MYILFSGECYYASGGYNDFTGQYYTLAQAVKAANMLQAYGDVGVDCEDYEMFETDSYDNHNRKHDGKFEWWHVVDSETQKIVAESGSSPYGSRE